MSFSKPFLARGQTPSLVLGLFCMAFLGALWSLHQNIKKNTEILREVRKSTEPTSTPAVEQLLTTAYQGLDIPLKGLIHIGAHAAEELPIYQKLNVHNVLWIEADPSYEKILKDATRWHPGSKVAIFAASDRPGKSPFFLAKGGGCSSLLQPKALKKAWPGFDYSSKTEVDQKRLDDFLADNPFDANVMVLDIQGAELMALKGATQTLQRVDAIVSEISYDELYDGSVLAEDLDAFLLTHGFVRVSSILKPSVREGDALYVKKRFLKIPDLQGKVLEK